MLKRLVFQVADRERDWQYAQEALRAELVEGSILLERVAQLPVDARTARQIERNLRSERLTLEDVMTEARGNDIAAVDEIKWAVLEAGGKITFVKK